MSLQGYYADCDDAYCLECFGLTFGQDGEGWPGFEGWAEPLSILSGEEVDSPVHCVRCERLLDLTLTEYGRTYVTREILEAVGGREGRKAILRAWHEAYADDVTAEIAAVIGNWPTADDYSPGGLKDYRSFEDHV